MGVVEKELVVAPKFVQRFTPLNVNEGETVTLNVRAVGTPVPRITWQKVFKNFYRKKVVYLPIQFIVILYFRMV